MKISLVNIFRLLNFIIKIKVSRMAIKSKIDEERFVPYNINAIYSELNHIKKTLSSLSITFPPPPFANSDENNDVLIATSIESDSFISKLFKVGVDDTSIINKIRGIKGYVVLFKEPIYVTSISFIRLPDLKRSNINNEILLITNEDKDWESIEFTSRDTIDLKGQISPICNVHRVARGIVIPEIYELDNLQYIPSNKVLSTNALTEIASSYKTIDSHTLSTLKRVTDFEESLKLKISEKSSQFDLLENKISTLEDEVDRLEEGYKVKEVIFNKLDKELSDNKSQLNLLETQKVSKTANIKNKNIELENLDIQKKTAVIELTKVENRLDTENKKLDHLNNDIRDAEKEKDLYSFDMKGFTKEARTQLNIYSVLSALLIGILGYIFYEIYDNAKGFLDLIPTIAGKSVSLLDILLSRLPMITASTLIIGAFSALLYFLVNHIIALNKEKMLMLKAHILTEQLSGSLEEHCEKAKLDPILLKKDIKIEMIMRLFDKERNINTDPKLDKNVIEILTKVVEEAKKSVK